MKKLLFSFLLIFVLIFSFYCFANAENEISAYSNEVLNNAFYIKIKDKDFKNSSWVGGYFSFKNFKDNKNINISLKENKGSITNMENDKETAKKFFEEFLLETSYIFSEDLKYKKEKVKKINGCYAAEFITFYENDSDDGYDRDLYVKGYVFANYEYIYCIIGSSETKNLNWMNSVVKTFKMNGMPLDTDKSHDNLIFVSAEDYKVQLERFSNVKLDSSEVGNINDSALVGAVLIFIIPIVVCVAVAIVFIIKYFKKKKILLQYEKSFGLLSADLNIDTIYLYLDQLKDSYNLVNYKI